MKKQFLKLISGIALSCLSVSSMAALLDLTDNSTLGALSGSGSSYTGTIDGIGFSLISTGGSINFNESYDGSLSMGCGILKCEKDGVGVGNDEVSSTTSVAQQLTLTFDSVVKISGLYFLDLYDGTSVQKGTEQSTITFDGVTVKKVDGVETSGQGGYAALSMSPIFAKTLVFSGDVSSAFWDDTNNDYALAGVDVSAVPVPAAAFLFAPALLGFMGLRRKAKNSIA